MAQVLVRDLEADTVARLKERASRNKRSLQAELKIILEQAAQSHPGEAALIAARIREKLAGRNHYDSGVSQAEDRDR